MKKAQEMCAVLAAVWASAAIVGFTALGNGFEITDYSEDRVVGVYTVSRGVLFLIATATVLSLAALVLAIIRYRRARS